MSIIPGTASVLGVTFSGALGAAVGVRTIFVVSGVILATNAVLAGHQFRRATRAT
ncbi:MAG TPA: hypothetical protein VFW65_19660 [Pseudonocardiaceae bacterium]|nr:hypothetical protein [Pseudonocardiaceae bacterium]